MPRNEEQFWHKAVWLSLSLPTSPSFLPSLLAAALATKTKDASERAIERG
jgi:hypothetical protein